MVRLARLSERYQMEKMPDLPELLSVIVNREDAEAIINMPVIEPQAVAFMCIFFNCSVCDIFFLCMQILCFALSSFALRLPSKLVLLCFIRAGL